MSEETINELARPGTAVNAKGYQRAEQIVVTAFQVLIEEGYAGFSTRKVAQRLGIRQSNLQYYFPTKVDLVQALFEHHVNSSLGAIDGFKGDERQRFLRGVTYFLESHFSQQQQIFLRELWALAAHDQEIANVMNRFYQQWIDQITQTIRQLNPAMSLRKAQKRALLVISMVDGLSLFHGAHGVDHVAVQGIEREIREVLLEMIGLPE